MAETTNISWCDSTFNPVVGCERISPACDFCYAANWAKRTGQAELWNGERRRTTDSNWRKPLQWDREHAAFFAEHGRRRRVFCASLADVFDTAWDPQWRSDLFKLIERTLNLDWLLLTKRIGNVRKMCGGVSAWPNVWLGATIANQEEADRDIPKLLATPARVRFLSCEPLLGPITLPREWLDGMYKGELRHYSTGQSYNAIDYRPKIDWVIAGGESGGKARPSHPDWFRSLRDQCASAGVPFHFKQWGEFLPRTADEADPFLHDVSDLKLYWSDGQKWDRFDGQRGGVELVARVGKKAAGRTLDANVWDQFPNVPTSCGRRWQKP